MKDFIKHSMTALGNLVRSDSKCSSDGNQVSKKNDDTRKELALRIDSCSQTVSQVKKLLAENSIRSDIQEHFDTLQCTLDNLDIDKLNVSDVENIEGAINRALRAIAKFLPDSALEKSFTKRIH